MGKKRVAPVAPENNTTPGEVVPYVEPVAEGEVLAPASPKGDQAQEVKEAMVAHAKGQTAEPSKKIAFVIVPGLINPPLGRFTLGDRVEWPNSSSVNPDHQDNVVIEDIRIRDRMVEIVGRSEGAEYRGQTCMWLTALVSCVVVYHGARPETLDPECVSDPTNGNVLHKKFLVKP